MNDTTYDASLYETYCKPYIVWSFTFPRDICLLCDHESAICLLQWTVFHKKRYIGNPMICQCTLIMDLLYLLVKFSHELEDIMAIYDNMRTNE